MNINTCHKSLKTYVIILMEIKIYTIHYAFPCTCDTRIARDAIIFMYVIIAIFKQGISMYFIISAFNQVITTLVDQVCPV